MALVVGLFGCAPPKQATPYPAEPAPEGEPASEASLPSGHVRIDERVTLDVAPVVRGWFPHGVHFARGSSAEDRALVWVDDVGTLWVLDATALRDAEGPSGALLDRARSIQGLDLSGRTLRAVARDVGTGTLRLLVRDDAGDAWVEVDARGRSTTLVDASAGIADIRRLSDGVTHVWTAGPASSGPARLLARGATPNEARVLATLGAGERFAAQPLVLDPDERVLWAAAIDAEGRPRIVQVARSATAAGEWLEATNVPLRAPNKSKPRGAPSSEPAASAVIHDVVLAADTVDGALVFATWDGTRSTLATWSPGRARFVPVLERPGRVRQLDVAQGGAVWVVVERAGVHVRERIELAGRRVSEASSLPASLALLGAIGDASLWAYSSPETPLTVVRTAWSRDGVSAADGEGVATNVPLLAPDEPTRAAKARCKATWMPAQGGTSSADGGAWRIEPVGDVVPRHGVTREAGSTAMLPWSADLALACAAGLRVDVEVEVDVAPPHASEGARASTVRWRRQDDAERVMQVELPFRTTPTRNDLAEAVAFVEFLVGGAASVTATTEARAETDGRSPARGAEEPADAP